MSFRNWMNQLRHVKGDQPLWPWLLCAALNDQFRHQSQTDEAYASEIFKDRSLEEPSVGSGERHLVAQLYQLCRNQNHGCLDVGGEPIWLLGYEWPNQGGNSEKGRRADLVGLREDGAVVVFECKRADNPDPPITALVEGLDYLSCMMRSRNFEKLLGGFDRFIEANGVPARFQGWRPRQGSRPSIVVLAPESYFKKYSERSKRGFGWENLAKIGSEACDEFAVAFAITEFDSAIAHKALRETAKDSPF